MKLANRLRDERPWGNFEQFTLNEPTSVKVITAEPNQALSLQYHHKRDEFWYLVEGSGTVVLGDEEIPAKAGDEFFIPRGTKHRVKTGAERIRWLEISFGEFDENDIVRLEDAYGRP